MPAAKTPEETGITVPVLCRILPFVGKTVQQPIPISEDVGNFALFKNCKHGPNIGYHNLQFTFVDQ